MKKSSRRLAGVIASLASAVSLVGLVTVGGGTATASGQMSRAAESSISIRVARRHVEPGETDRVTGNRPKPLT